MKIGMNMGLWSDDLTHITFLPLFSKLKELGYDGVEIPLFNSEPKDVENLSVHLKTLDLELHASSALVGEESGISSNQKHRELGLEKMKRILDICQAAEIPQLIGPLYAPLGVFTDKPRTQKEWDRGVKWMGDVSEYAKTCGVTLALEFLNRFEVYFLNCAKDMAEFIREVNHPNCKMMYDTFHANIEEKNIEDALITCSDVLQHVHISENDRSTPGKGQVNWNETFRLLKQIHYDNWLTIEAFGQKLESLAAATKIWRPMFADEMTLAKDGIEFIQNCWNEEFQGA